MDLGGYKALIENKGSRCTCNKVQPSDQKQNSLEKTMCG